MNRLDRILLRLQESGCIVESCRRLNGGINSSVFQLTNSIGEKYLLKVYPSSVSNLHQNRCFAEQNFLRYIGSCNIDRIPELYASDYLEGWSLMSWIEGERPVSLDSSDFIEITTFIDGINCPSSYKERAKLHPASEAIQSSSCLLNSISKRIQGLKSVVPKTQICSEAIAWVDRIIEPYFYVLGSRFEGMQSDRSHRKSSSQAIASPSDVGIHNLIRSKDGLYFFDFNMLV